MAMREGKKTKLTLLLHVSVHLIRPLVVFSALQLRKPLKNSLAGRKDESDEFSELNLCDTFADMPCNLLSI